MQDGICQLCKQPKELLESHIVPRFIYRHFKETSATGYLRHNECINRRVQDGAKRRLLCAECEGNFNEWETIVANKLYYPLAKGNLISSRYGPWLLKFAVSVSWRVLLWISTVPNSRRRIKGNGSYLTPCEHGKTFC